MGTIRIISREERPFADRVEAGRLLAAELRELQGQDPLVLGIPRGGVVIAAEIVREIGGEMDIALARKLRAPLNPELAVGAMGEDGEAYVDRRITRYLGLTEEALQREQDRVRQEIEDRRALYREKRERAPLRDRVVVLTDDGLATGSTMRAAAHAAESEQPRLLIIAVPVASEETLHDLAPLVDQIICLRVPMYFAAVGQFYRDFAQVSDETVLELLAAEHERMDSLASLTVRE